MDSGNYLAYLSSGQLAGVGQGASYFFFRPYQGDLAPHKPDAPTINDGIDEPIGLQLHWDLHWASQPPAPPIIPHLDLEHQQSRLIDHGNGRHAEPHLPPGGSELVPLDASQPLPAPVQDDEAAVHEANEHVANRCGDDCVGVFVGVHRCERNPLKITCGTINCRSTFHRRTEFNRHFECSHSGQLEKLDCPHANCPKVGQRGFSRKDNLLQHRRKVHKERIEVVKMRLNGRGKTQTTV